MTDVTDIASAMGGYQTANASAVTALDNQLASRGGRSRAAGAAAEILRLLASVVSARAGNPLTLPEAAGYTISNSATAPTGKTLKALVPIANGALDTTLMSLYGVPNPYGGNGNYVQLKSATVPTAATGNLATGAGVAIAARGSLVAGEMMVAESSVIIWLRAAGGNPAVRFLVDGQYISKTITNLTAANNYITITGFPAGAARRLKIEMQEDSAFVGAYYTTVAPVPPDTTNQLRMGVLMHSYGQTTPPGGAMWDNSMAVLGKLLGIVDVRSSSLAGTGIVNPGPTWKFGDHLADITGFNPQVVVTGDPFNDANATYGGQVQAGSLALFQAIRAALPRAIIIVLGSSAGSSGPSTDVIAAEGAVKAAYTAFADPLSIYVPMSVRDAGPLINGTYNSGNGTSTGNIGTYINLAETPPTHPTIAGGRFIGQWEADSIYASLVAMAA